MISAYIPARSGSKRIPNKNIRIFCGHPLLAYAIQGALDAALFDGGIYVSTDSEEIGAIAGHYGATFIRRPDVYAGDRSPDAEWIAHLQETLKPPPRHFAILRPTNPFRTAATIRRAFEQWDRSSHMKAVEPVSQHPGKMWVVKGAWMEPLWPGVDHLCQTNTLRKLYVQNASLEFRAWPMATSFQSFFTEGYEGFDLNAPDDWILAEALVGRGLASTPRIERRPYGSAVQDDHRDADGALPRGVLLDQGARNAGLD